MSPASQRPLQAPIRRLLRWQIAAAIGISACAPGVGFVPGMAFAQEPPTAEAPLSGSTGNAPGNIAENDQIGFEADGLEYQQNSEVVTAKGNVVLRRDGQTVRADTVTWNRKSGEILATGNIRFVDADGNQLYVDKLELTDQLKAGAMENMLLALREGGRLAAERGTRAENGTVILERAAYTGCEVEDASGCPKRPSWRITARQVVYDPAKKTVRFTGARLELFGVRLIPLPGLLVATDGRAISGPLIPDLRLSASNGVEINETYYRRISDNRDLAVTGYVYTKALPMLSAQYRALTSKGAYQVTGYVTRSEVIPFGGVSNGQDDDWRGYIYANGKFQLDPKWSVTFSGRLASDRTFLRRYDISRDDRLRSTFDVERIDDKSYLSISGWATQTMRLGESQGQQPIALPLIDYRRRIADPLLGGQIELQANTLALTRTLGQDTQRAFVSAQWSLRKLTTMGQEVTFTALVRGDVYHSDQNALSNPVYAGSPGWQGRGVAIGAVDVKWPFVGSFMGGTQVFTPRIQFVATPPIRNLAIPNEDSRAIELDDSNLFSLNRFPGYDRVEDGARVTYGVDWQWERPKWRISSTIGQSYRLSDKPTLFPGGTGLPDRFSDFVGRTELRYRDFFKLTHRFRIDKDSFAFRRNEIDATVGSQRTYLEVGYLRLNRDINFDQLIPITTPATLPPEDLRDREELRLSARVAFAKYWSLFGAGVFDLTKDPTVANSDGFQALRTRLGAAYQDDCMEIAFTWR
ncbi:MAG: organic solvent tolerance protein, partial [Novosphingobium sp.]|nr:organic solvent tolerance protein [Novosphingobium sp.]